PLREKGYCCPRPSSPATSLGNTPIEATISVARKRILLPPPELACLQFDCLFNESIRGIDFPGGPSYANEQERLTPAARSIAPQVPGDGTAGGERQAHEQQTRPYRLRLL